MERELIRHSESYWSLVDERGTVICRFKVGDKVKVLFKTFPQGEKTEEAEGVVHEISFGTLGCNLVMLLDNRYFLPIEIETIIKMEVNE